MKLDELSFSDLKAIGEFVEELKKERLDDLKIEERKSTDDHSYQRLDKLSFHVHNRLFSFINKLKP